MSAMKALICDGRPGCTGVFVFAGGVKDARREAAREGWYHVHTHSTKDLCPRHAEGWR